MAGEERVNPRPKRAIAALELSQTEVNEIFDLILDIMAEREKSFVTCSEAFTKMRKPGNIIHDYLYLALGICESGCVPDLVDTMLEIAQRKLEIERTPTYREIALITFLRDIVPYIQVKASSPEHIFQVKNMICTYSLHDYFGQQEDAFLMRGFTLNR